MRKSTLVVLVLSTLALGCTSATSTGVPTVDADTTTELQARAFERACGDVLCAGTPILVPDSTSDGVREALTAFSDEIRYVAPRQAEEEATPDGRFKDDATLIDVGEVRRTERNDVVRVDASITRAVADIDVRSYLFHWNGSGWIDASPDAVDVTITSVIS